jgi:hypothetical protein
VPPEFETGNKITAVRERRLSSLAPSMPHSRPGPSTETFVVSDDSSGATTELIRAGRRGDSVPCLRTTSGMRLQCKLMNTLDIVTALLGECGRQPGSAHPLLNPSPILPFVFEFPRSAEPGRQTKSPDVSQCTSAASRAKKILTVTRKGDYNLFPLLRNRLLRLLLTPRRGGTS